MHSEQDKLPALGLDVGTRRIGVAISDPGGTYALPVETVDASDSQAAAGRVAKLVDERQIKTLIVGMPLEMSGAEGMAARRVRAFLRRLDTALTAPIPVVEWDERLTTSAAEQFLISADVSRQRRKQVVDQIAATHILEGWLRGQQQGGGR